MRFLKLGNKIDLLVERSKISIKALFEYKANLYSILFFDFILSLAFGLFLFVFGGLVSDILFWSNYDFIVYFIVLLIGAKFKWAFSLIFFSHKLIKGDLNLVLTKPVSVYFFENLQERAGGTLVTAPILFLIFLVCSYFFGFSFLNVFYGSLILIFGIYYEIVLINFFESLAFYFKKNDFLVNLFFRVSFANETYTPKLFESLTTGFYFLSTSIYGFFIVEVLNSRYDLFLWILPWIVLIILVLKVLIYFIWRNGLRSYEAFG